MPPAPSRARAPNLAAGLVARPEGSPPGNAPEVTVSDLSAALKRTVEDAFGFVRLRGEISGYRGPHASGHAYFALKDAGAKIDAVIWKGSFGKLRVKPEEGMEVVATGRVTTYPGKSSYQIVVESLEPAGAGALLAMLEERRRRLAAEGLFAAERKRAIPYLPGVIGIVTSPTGAVIRDILHRLADRFPRRVLLWPVRVQGEGSAAEVAAAVAGLNALPREGLRVGAHHLPRPDVLIVARGGGSLEDLWGFNDEALVRAAAASLIPLISAVGHETDRTLLDEAADHRAPTPTAAAERAVPVRADLAADLGDRAARLGGGLARGLERARGELRGLARLLPGPEALLAPARQRLDLGGGRLVPALELSVAARRRRLDGLGLRLARLSPRAQIERQRGRLAALGGRLRPGTGAGLRIAGRRLAAAAARLDGARAAGAARRSRQGERLAALVRRADLAGGALVPARRGAAGALAARGERAKAVEEARRRAALARLGGLLGALSYRSALERGFALVRDDADGIVRTAAEAAQAPGLVIQFADGTLRAIPDPGHPPAPDEAPTASAGAAPAPARRPAAPPRPRPRAAAAAQASLFGAGLFGPE